MRKGYRKRTTAGDKTICLPLPEGLVYEEGIEDSVGYRQYLDEQIAAHPELFPPEIPAGDWFDGLVVSKRHAMKTRRILWTANRQADPIRPDTVMPDMIGKTAAVEKGLYLRRYGMPYEGNAHVLGHNPMYWYHATQA
jgi:hypothetical protein